MMRFALAGSPASYKATTENVHKKQEIDG
uniref:Uncharacterized protein n=1 Tax=Candidatus Kentrum sp. FM TaxID=2126340 RepID=A0A450TK99_9GAMM|nr:MAG: hypothetical protein BECKFM1743A_GA0114220_104612 [Candidatus Kentron sp. FM]VFJ68754.1 MAG: hypothetical protein BECKFM1743C_GA0114222_104981 [Candidatus Kentron sp. FM]VFK10759.1 MAG: hypothetical protein BECKFM1743B_GA0114221_101538 [Candidatus Kentron sp. FM]